MTSNSCYLFLFSLLFLVVYGPAQAPKPPSVLPLDGFDFSGNWQWRVHFATIRCTEPFSREQ